MTISSNVSSWPDVPARFESLNDDTLTTILQFVGNKSYRSFGGLNYHCREIYLNTKGMKKETFLCGYAPLAVITNRIKKFDSSFYRQVAKGVVFYNRRDVFIWASEKRNNGGILFHNRRDLVQERKTYLLSEICELAAMEGRLDILNEVLNNIDNEGDKRSFLFVVDCHAACGGKLDVLKWLEDKGFSIGQKICAREAALHGQLHILKWLKYEKGLKLLGELYYNAINGGHLHIMKWLREHEVPWNEADFREAAYVGKVDVLQWLHEEGCPWPDRLWSHVFERLLEPEVLEWLLANGYRNRIEYD